MNSLLLRSSKHDKAVFYLELEEAIISMPDGNHRPKASSMRTAEKMINVGETRGEEVVALP